MEFAIKQSAMLIRKSGKRQMTEEIELPNQDKIRTFAGKEIYKYLEVLLADTIKYVNMKEKIKKRILQENKKTTQNQTIL